MTSYFSEKSIKIPFVDGLPLIVFPAGNLVYDLVTSAAYVSNGSVWSLCIIPGGILPVANGGTGSDTPLIGNRLMVSVPGAIEEDSHASSAVSPTFVSFRTTTTPIAVFNLGALASIRALNPTGPRVYNVPDVGASANYVYTSAGRLFITNVPTAGQVLKATSTFQASWQTPSTLSATALATSSVDIGINSTSPSGATQYLRTTSTTVATWQPAVTASGGSFVITNAPAATYNLVGTSASTAAWTNPAQIQTIFFGKTGNDLNNGYSTYQAVLTFGVALTRASLLSPSVNFVVAVVCLDGGTYVPTSSFNIPSYVCVSAPSATLQLDAGIICTPLTGSEITFFRLIDNNPAGSWGIVTPLTSDCRYVVDATYFSGSGGFQNYSGFSSTIPYIRLKYVDKADGILFAAHVSCIFSADIGVCTLSGTAQFAVSDNNSNVMNIEIKTLISTSTSFVFENSLVGGQLNLFNVFCGDMNVAAGTLWNSEVQLPYDATSQNQFYLTVNNINDYSYTGNGILQMNDNIETEYTVSSFWTDGVTPVAAPDTSIKRNLGGRVLTYNITGWTDPAAHVLAYISMPGALPVGYRPGYNMTIRILGINTGIYIDASASVSASTGDLNIYAGASNSESFPASTDGGFYSFTFSFPSTPVFV